MKVENDENDTANMVSTDYIYVWKWLGVMPIEQDFPWFFFLAHFGKIQQHRGDNIEVVLGGVNSSWKKCENFPEKMLESHQKVTTCPDFCRRLPAKTRRSCLQVWIFTPVWLVQNVDRQVFAWDFFRKPGIAPPTPRPQGSAIGLHLQAEKSGSVRDHYLTENKASGRSQWLAANPWVDPLKVSPRVIFGVSASEEYSNGREDLEILVKCENMMICRESDVGALLAVFNSSIAVDFFCIRCLWNCEPFWYSQLDSQGWGKQTQNEPQNWSFFQHLPFRYSSYCSLSKSSAFSVEKGWIYLTCAVWRMRLFFLPVRPGKNSLKMRNIWSCH